MQLTEILDKTYPLSEASKALLEAHFTEITLPKGHILLRPDTVERMVYFIKRGSARAYSDLGEEETTFWFGIEGAPLLSMRNYVYGAPSYEYVELLERCELYAIDIDKLKALFSADLGIANWGRIFAEHELVKTEERLISRQFKAAEDRYLELLQHYPEFILRVPLRHIASYLGITPISLSRIRKQIRDSY